MRIASFRRREQGQVTIRERVHNHTVADDSGKAGYLLPARGVLQKLVEWQRWQCECLHSQYEAIQKYTSACHRSSGEKPSSSRCGCAKRQQTCGKQPEQDDFGKENRRAEWLVTIELPRLEARRRRRDVQPDERVDRLGGDVNRQQHAGNERQPPEHLLWNKPAASNFFYNSGH